MLFRWALSMCVVERLCQVRKVLTVPLQGGELVYSGTSLALLPAALESYSAMQAGSSPVVKGGIILAYKVAPGSAPAAILQVFYNVSPQSCFEDARASCLPPCVLYRAHLHRATSSLPSMVSPTTLLAWAPIPTLA